MAQPKQFNVRLPSPLIDKVRDDAKARGVSVNKVAEWALEQWLEFTPPPERPFYDLGQQFDQAGQPVGEVPDDEMLDDGETV